MSTSSSLGSSKFVRSLAYNILPRQMQVEYMSTWLEVLPRCLHSLIRMLEATSSTMGNSRTTANHTDSSNTKVAHNIRVARNTNKAAIQGNNLRLESHNNIIRTTRLRLPSRSTFQGSYGSWRIAVAQSCDPAHTSGRKGISAEFNWYPEIPRRIQRLKIYKDNLC